MKIRVLVRRGTGRSAVAEVRQHPDRDRLASAMAVEVSEPMITWARRVVKRGVPELVIAVEEGRVALYMAAQVARWEEPRQLAFLQLARPVGEGCTITARCLITSSAEHDA